MCIIGCICIYIYIVCQWGQYYCTQCVFVFCVFLYCICIWQLSSTKPPLYLVSQTACFSQFKFRVQTIYILRTFLKIKLFWRKMKLTNKWWSPKMETWNSELSSWSSPNQICFEKNLQHSHFDWDIRAGGWGGQMGVWVTGFSEKLSWKSEDNGHGWYD